MNVLTLNSCELCDECDDEYIPFRMLQLKQNEKEQRDHSKKGIIEQPST